uniref:EB domain-containing protein n=1 Tax=Anopheles minimus TaxID=112268 RepID=A0A182WIR0_9DIPT
MYPDRRLFLVVLYVFAIQLRLSIGGNPRDSAQVSARNAPNNATNSSSARNSSTNTVACREDVLDQCPPNASCDRGQCVCLFGYKLNPAYHGKNTTKSLPPTSVPNTDVAYTTYCLPDDTGAKATSLHGGYSSDASKSSGEIGVTSGEGGNMGELPLREPVGAHHILGGVLIPLAFVVILVGSAVLAKRTDLWSRLRQRLIAHRNRHRRRPAYEDVVLGNDSDDPPLI